MGVAQLYHHLAPRSEVMVVAKALIRLLRSHREVQSVVLNCIASISTLRKVCIPYICLKRYNLMIYIKIFELKYRQISIMLGNGREEGHG
jgi:hypothetical protein